MDSLKNIKEVYIQDESSNKLVLELRSKVTNKIMDSLSDCISSTQNGAKVYEKHEEVLSSWHNFYNESSDSIVEVHNRWMLALFLIGILFVGVLVCVVIIKGTFMIPSWHNIQVIV